MSRTFWTPLTASLLLFTACTQSPERANPSSEPGASTGTSSPSSSAPAGKPAAPTEEAAPPAPSKSAEAPRATKKVDDKAQPKPAPAPAAIPDEKQLIIEARELAARFVQTCGAGDAATAKKLAFSSDDFEAALQPGHRDILEGSITAQNTAIIDRLAALLAGKTLREELRPGTLSRTVGGGSFRNSPPLLSNSVLLIDVNGTPIEIVFDQLVYTGGTWKIFRLSAP
jgi:hypothetical protein